MGARLSTQLHLMKHLECQANEMGLSLGASGRFWVGIGWGWVGKGCEDSENQALCQLRS